MKTFALFFILVVFVESKIHVFDAKVTTIPAQRGTRLYFLTNGNEADLKLFTVKAEKSHIDTNVYAYSVPRPDGSLNPLTITADDDTVVLTRPDGYTTPVSVYNDTFTENLNVFPVFEKSSLQFKAGKNVYFAVDQPNGKILTIQNLKIDRQSNGYLRAYSLPDKSEPEPYLFFDSEIKTDVSVFQQLDIPINQFSLDPVFDGVTYTVSFGDFTKTLQTSGLIMSPGFPTTLQPSDVSYSVKRNGDEQISIQLNPHFYSAVPYETNIIVHYGFGVEQGNSLSSQLAGKLVASGGINSVEVNSIGSYAIQYFSNSTATYSKGSTVPAGQGTTASVMTTTKSSHFIPIGLSMFTVVISLFIC